MQKKILALSAALALPTLLSAAIINVPGDQATIQLAVAAANTTGDEIVIAPGTYDTGGININEKSLIIRGSSSANRPIVVLSQVGTLAGAGGATTAGMVISGDGDTVTVQDIIFIPSTTSIPVRLIQATTNTADATITANFTNILMTGNAGGNVPSVTNVFDTATALGTTNTSDHMYLVNYPFGAGLFSGIGVYTLTDVVSIGGGREGITCYPNGGLNTAGSLTGSGIKVSRATRNPIQWGDGDAIGSDFIVTGTRANPGLLLVNNTGNMTGPGVTGINGADVISLDYLVYLNNSEPLYLTGDATSITVTNSLIANTPAAFDGIVISNGTAANSGPVVISGSTFFANGAVAQNTAGIWLEDVDPTYTITNNIFAGVSGSDHGGIVYQTGTGAKTTLTNNNLVTSGANALASAEFGGGSPATTSSANVFVNPQFTSTSITSLADLTTAFDVQSPALQGAGTAGSDISGWGDLNVLPEPTAAENWNLYL